MKQPTTKEIKTALLDWLGTIEGAALGALDPEGRIEHFEDALRRQAELSPLPSENSGSTRPEHDDALMPGLFMLREGQELSSWLAQVFCDAGQLKGHSVWWSFAVDGDRIPAAIVRGLPGAQSYARMIGGSF